MDAGLTVRKGLFAWENIAAVVNHPKDLSIHNTPDTEATGICHMFG